MSRNRFSEMSVNGMKAEVAALLTSTSIGPRSATTRSTNAARDSDEVRSTWYGNARPPAASMSATVSRRVPGMTPCAVCSRLLAATATTAPSQANRFAMAAPIPRLAPVTRATRPSSGRAAPCSREVMMPLPASSQSGDAGAGENRELFHELGIETGLAERSPVAGLVDPGEHLKHPEHADHEPTPETFIGRPADGPRRDLEEQA